MELIKSPTCPLSLASQVFNPAPDNSLFGTCFVRNPTIRSLVLASFATRRLKRSVSLRSCYTHIRPIDLIDPATMHFPSVLALAAAGLGAIAAPTYGENQTMDLSEVDALNLLLLGVRPSPALYKHPSTPADRRDIETHCDRGLRPESCQLYCRASGPGWLSSRPV